MKYYISKSTLRDFTCLRRQAFVLAGWRKARKYSYFAMGGAFHRYLEAYYSTDPDLEGAEKDATTYLLKELPDVITDTEIESYKQTLSRMMHLYPELSKAADEEDEIEPQAIETYFNLPLTKVGDRDYRIVGILDLYTRTTIGNAILDHKTSSRVGPSYFRNYNISSEVILYAWAARELSIPCVAFGVNVITTAKTTKFFREWFPIRWDYIDRSLDWLRERAKFWATLPTDVDDIMTLPGAFECCRGCIFYPVCDADERGYANDILQADYEIADHSRFAKLEGKQ